MSAVMNMRSEDKASIWGHLLGGDGERAAFAYAVPHADDERLSLRLHDFDLIPDASLVSSDWRHVALDGEAQATVIKRAWDSDTLIVEFHSHPWVVDGVRFSRFDLDGLREFVPHCWWRLRGRPYVAIVVGGDGSFDALVWTRDARTPEVLLHIDVDGEVLSPSNQSIEDWNAMEDLR